jgi:hypothetical protein
MVNIVDQKSKKFYVYSLIDPRNGSVFYVGKGQGSRTKRHLRACVAGIHDNPKLQNKVNKILKKGLVYEAEIMFSSACEAECFRKEEEWILFYGRASLCNLTDGGEGASGYKHTPEAIKKMKEWHLGKPLTEDHRKNIGDSQRGEKSYMFGKTLSEERRKEVSEATQKAMDNLSEESRVRMRNAKHPTGEKHWTFNHVFSEEHRQNMRNGQLGKKASEETKRKRSASLMGHRAPKGEDHPWFGKKGPEHPVFGRKASEEEKQKMRKISEVDALEIKNSKGIVKQAVLAAKFGVSKASVSRIQSDTQWK